MTTPYGDQTARPGSPGGYGSGPAENSPADQPTGYSAPPTGYPAPPSDYPATDPGSYPPPGPGRDEVQAGANRPASADTGARHPAAGFDERGHVRRGRISTLWITLIVAAVGLILLIVFIAQNSKVVPIHFLGWAGHLAVGLTVLIAAVVGLLLAAIPGTIRIIQLRKALKTNVPKGQRRP